MSLLTFNSLSLEAEIKFITLNIDSSDGIEFINIPYICSETCLIGTS